MLDREEFRSQPLYLYTHSRILHRGLIHLPLLALLFLVLDYKSEKLFTFTSWMLSFYTVEGRNVLSLLP